MDRQTVDEIEHLSIMVDIRCESVLGERQDSVKAVTIGNGTRAPRLNPCALWSDLRVPYWPMVC